MGGFNIYTDHMTMHHSCKLSKYKIPFFTASVSHSFYDANVGRTYEIGPTKKSNLQKQKAKAACRTKLKKSISDSVGYALVFQKYCGLDMHN